MQMDAEHLSHARTHSHIVHIDQVPSLSRCIDHYVDVFGYSQDQVIFIHKSFVQSRTVHEFTVHVAPALDVTVAQAGWMYKFIDM